MEELQKMNKQERDARLEKEIAHMPSDAQGFIKEQLHGADVLKHDFQSELLRVFENHLKRAVNLGVEKSITMVVAAATVQQLWETAVKHIDADPVKLLAFESMAEALKKAAANALEQAKNNEIN